MEISWKKLILIIIVSYFALNIVFGAIWFFINYEAEPDLPDYDATLTKDEMEDILDNTVFALGADMAKKECTEKEELPGGDYEFVGCGNEFLLGDSTIRIYINDMSNWSADTKKTFTGDPNVTWDEFVKKEYNRIAEMYAESAYHTGMYYEDTHTITQVMGYDAEIGTTEPVDYDPFYYKSAKTVIGKYQLGVFIKMDNEIVLEVDVKPYLEILIRNFLNVLDK